MLGNILNLIFRRSNKFLTFIDIASFFKSPSILKFSFFFLVMFKLILFFLLFLFSKKVNLLSTFIDKLLFKYSALIIPLFKYIKSWYFLFINISSNFISDFNFISFTKLFDFTLNEKVFLYTPGKKSNSPVIYDINGVIDKECLIIAENLSKKL